jgi:hypothetical protein
MNSVSGDHSLSAPRGLDYALLQSQLVCLFYILLSCCVTMYRGSVSAPLSPWPNGSALL